MSETGHRRTSRHEADARGSRVGTAATRVVVIVLGAALTSFACALFAIGGEHLAHRRATDSFPEPGDPTELLLPLWGTAFVFGVLPALTVLPWTRVQRSVPFVAVGTALLGLAGFWNPGLGLLLACLGGWGLMLYARFRFALPVRVRQPWSDLP